MVSSWVVDSRWSAARGDTGEFQPSAASKCSIVGSWTWLGTPWVTFEVSGAVVLATRKDPLICSPGVSRAPFLLLCTALEPAGIGLVVATLKCPISWSTDDVMWLTFRVLSSS